LTVVSKAPNRLLLSVTAPVKTVEAAFHVKMRVYQHPTEARTFYAPDVEPSVPSTCPIIEIGGLENYHLPKPGVRITPIPNGPTPYTGGGSRSGFFWTTDFRHAYAPGVSLNGAGQTIGLVEFDGYDSGTMQGFQSTYNASSVPLTNILIGGFDGSVLGGGVGENDLEVLLDLQMALSMAPGLHQITVYETTNSANELFNEMAFPSQGEPFAYQISCSWSITVSNVIVHQVLAEMAAQGQSFFQASGDSGAWCDGIPQPSDDPYATIVGGTDLFMTNSDWGSEAVWNTNKGSGLHASGGGISTNFSIPFWQQGLSMSANGGSTTNRNTPDVACVADNINLMFGVGNPSDFTSASGTSAAAPLWAGFMALVNQQAVSNSVPRVGFANPAIYAIGTGASYSSTFHDITSGANTNGTCGFDAVSGYDLATGWGSMTGSNLINALVSPCSAPTLSSPQIVSGGDFEFTATGTSGSSWSVFASTNAIDWSEIGSVTLTGGSANYTDSSASSYTNRFYMVSQGGCSSKAVGFTHVTVPADGEAIIANQLNTTNNNVSPLLDSQLLDGNHDGVTLYKWVNGSGYTTLTVETRINGGWSGTAATNTTLNPGEAALMTNPFPSALVLTFTGALEAGDGLQVSLPTGWNMVSSIVPQPGAVDTNLGLTEVNGDVTEIYDSSVSGGYDVYTGDSTKSPPWDAPTGKPPGPTVGIGEGFWYENNGASTKTWTQRYFTRE